MYKELSISAFLNLTLASSTHRVHNTSILTMLWLLVMVITMLTATIFIRGVARQVRANGRFGE
jgi:hypothetical protein